MSKYYRGKRKQNIFDPKSTSPFKLSRTRLSMFLECPRCFYIDRRLGVDRPPGFPFSLNSAVDILLKKEFDAHRAAQTPHPLMTQYGIDAVPFQHEKLEEWRDAMRRGISYLQPATNLQISGGIDDIWVNRKGELLIADYKATSKEEEVNLDADWQIAYKRQIEIYQWLFRKNGFKVSKTGYFVYCNGDTSKESFDGKLEFDVKLIPYEGNDSWVEPAVMGAYKCLMSETVPNAAPDCDYCLYRDSVEQVL
ncbi:MAG: PD-(D/E)XK nuclease family protein [Elusimicrobia bacterium]|nr:PD-(D/E)XK nuclease family protein [Elusimicrobiota bacterium]